MLKYQWNEVNFLTQFKHWCDVNNCFRLKFNTNFYFTNFLDASYEYFYISGVLTSLLRASRSNWNLINFIFIEAQNMELNVSASRSIVIYLPPVASCDDRRCQVKPVIKRNIMNTFYEDMYIVL